MSQQWPILQLSQLTLQDSNNNSTIQVSDLSLHPGEVHAVLCSQSYIIETMMRFFKNRISVTEGSIHYNNQLVFVKQLLKTRKAISLISENDDLYQSFTGLDNIFFFEKKYVHGRRAEFQERCQDYLNRYHLNLDLYKKATELTREERKTVEIMRAYFSESKIVILQETISRIGESFAAQFSMMLNDWKQRGIAILYLTTQASDALAIADKITVFSENRISGCMLKKEAKANLGKLFGLLAGGSLFQATHKEKQEHDLLSVISAARDIMSTNRELKTTLSFLADNLKRINAAESCIIYIINESDNLIISSEVKDNDYAQLEPQALRDLLEALSETPKRYTRTDEGFFRFHNTTGIDQIDVYPVFVRYDISALILLSYTDEKAASDQDVSLIQTFCREVRIAMETSLILEHSSLLQESHHRIKNNLQSIIGLIYMEKYTLKEQKNLTREMMDESLSAIVNRIKSIASIHDLLSKDRFGWNNVDLEWITRRILQFYEKSDIAISIKMDSLQIPYNKATSFSLLMNELISNCTKHAFIGIDTDKRIDIVCKIQNNDELLLRVADNGTGLAASISPEKQTSVGMNVICSIAQEFNAKLHYYSDHGTIAELLIPMETMRSI